MTLGGVRAALLAMTVLPAAAEDAKAPALPFRLEPAKPVEITCLTKSVVVATDAANATTGTLRLGLLLKDATARPQTGAWRIVEVGAAHIGSLGKREAKTCAEACPLTIAADAHIELWSPAPKGIDQLADKEPLLLAVLKTDSLDLRATTFSGKQIESLEEGHCRIGS